MAKLSCPQECQDKHNGHEITMTKILGRLDNIEDKLDASLENQKDIITRFEDICEQKADKTEVNDLKSKYWIAVAGAFSLLFAIIFMLIKVLLEHSHS
jgi:hypothetical protein